MTVKDIMADTGMKQTSAYAAVSTGALPVPVYRFGGRYMVSRRAWEEMKTRHLEEDHEVTAENNQESSGASAAVRK